MKYLETMSDEDIGQVEMPFGQIIIYNVSADGLRTDSSVAKIDTEPTNA